MFDLKNAILLAIRLESFQYQSNIDFNPSVPFTKLRVWELM